MSDKGQNTINRIKAEAMKLFLQRGYKDVSMQDICNACDLSKGGLYRHFKSKAEILLSLVQEERKFDVQEQIEKGKTATEILCEYLDVFYRNMLAWDKSLAFAMFEYATVEKDSRLLCEDEKDMEIWKTLIAYGVSKGEFREVDFRSVMNTLIYAYRGIRMWSRAIDIDENVPRSVIEMIKHTVIKDYKENCR